jgi:hypothetical protein
MFSLSAGQHMSNANSSQLCVIAKGRSTLLAACAIACLIILNLSAAAQAVQTAGLAPPDPSRLELYAGYGYFHPVEGEINTYVYQPINSGLVTSVTGYFNRYLGVQAEGAFFPNGPNDCVFSAQAGPVFRYQKGRFVPFLHVLGGGAKVGGPVFQPCTWGWGFTGGMGLDYILPVFGNHIAVRPIQADFDYSHVDYGPLVLPGGVSGGLGEISAYRLSAGLVLRFGAVAMPPPIQLGCTLEPTNAYPGDPITITAAPANLNLKRKATYTWSSNGGQLTPHEETATVSTAGLAPGEYTISGHVSQGIRPGDQASCTTGFRVHEIEPPTISCTASPSTVQPGDTSTISSTGISPQNRTLTYSYSASAGIISGNTSSVSLLASGASAGTIIVSCTVIDDLGKQATSTTTVTVMTPPPTAAPQTKQLCSLSFIRDKRRPVRVDNEAKGCLDEIALTLNRDSTSKLVIVGRHSSDESPDTAAQRTLNVELYLTHEKGIDPSRLELRTGGELTRTVEDTLVPQGATFIVGDTVTFDRNSIKVEGQPYAPNRDPDATPINDHD